MRIFFFFFLFSFFSQTNGAFSQDSIPIQKVNHCIELGGNAFINSNTISNDLIWAFYRGEFISEELKQGASGRISGSNRLGGCSKLGFKYLIHLQEEKKSQSFSFSFFDRQHLDVKFSDDLFHIIFYGNKLFAGETALLGGFSFNFLRYQQFRFGWDKKRETNHRYGFALSLLNGEQNLSVKAPTADLFTASDGTYMDFSLSVDVHQTDSARKKYFARNGMGLSTDFYYEIPYTLWKKNGKITFELNDLGFIRWNNNSMHYSADSSYHYEGVEVADLFNLDSISTQLHIDKVIDKNTKFENKRYTTNIPFTLKLHTVFYSTKRTAFEYGMMYRINTSSKLYYYTKFHFFIGKENPVCLSYTLGYGDYGKLHSGLEAKIDFAKYYSLHVINNYLFSGIAIPSSAGMGLYLKLAMKF